MQDLVPQVYYGNGYITESLENFDFKISPKSFFQTNSKQAESLYQVTRSFAELTGKEVVYDLYCGTGSIGIFCSQHAKKIIGVEVVADAIEDAKENARINNLTQTAFLLEMLLIFAMMHFLIPMANQMSLLQIHHARACTIN